MIRPVDLAPTQLYGDNPTSTIHPGSPDYWIIELYGNYQPDGHAGQDYPCKAGTPVRAVADGVVLHIGRLGGTYADNPWWIAPDFAGYVAVIDHGSFIGIYGHCMDGSGKVKAGQRVSEGQVFVLSGNTGASTGDHLHFEILPDGYILGSRMYGRIDPEPLFTGLSYAGTTITPIEQDWLTMATQQEVADAAYEGCLRALGWAIDTDDGKKLSVLGMVGAVLPVLEKMPDRILDNQTPRAGEFGGNTSLRGVLAYADQKHIEALRAIVTAAHADGTSADVIIKAVQEALAAGVKVEASVKVGN